MRLNIWFWFMEFVLFTFVLLWVCQVLFLQNFYDRRKRFWFSSSYIPQR